MICAGIDAGSRTVKIVLLDAKSQEVVASATRDQGVEPRGVAGSLFESLLADNDLSRPDVARVVATGYARNVIEEADATVTEISCHARGVIARRPDARTVIEIGGQDSKLLRLDDKGRVRDFDMNDRCAAGTGRFLEVVAQRLELRLDELGALAERSRNPAPISSMCVVFAETEIIGLLSSGHGREDVVAGVRASIASRIVAMAGGKLEDPVVFTGGVALIPGMDKALAEALGRPVATVADPQTTGALGAALLARGQLPSGS